LEEIEGFSSDEIKRWLAYASEYGLPDTWLQTAQICTTISASVGVKTRLEDYTPSPVRVSPMSELEAFIRATGADRPPLDKPLTPPRPL
jgi:hypothetical protein